MARPISLLDYTRVSGNNSVNNDNSDSDLGSNPSVPGTPLLTVFGTPCGPPANVIRSHRCVSGNSSINDNNSDSGLGDGQNRSTPGTPPLTAPGTPPLTTHGTPCGPSANIIGSRRCLFSSHCNSQRRIGNRVKKRGNVRADFGSPLKTALGAEYVGAAFLHVISDVTSDEVCAYISELDEHIDEDYVTTLTRFSVRDVLRSLPTSTSFHNYVVASEDGTTRSAREYIVAYICYKEKAPLANVHDEWEASFPSGAVLTAELISVSKLLQKLSAVGPIVRMSLSPSRLNNVQCDFVDDRILNSFEKFLMEHDCPIEKRNVRLLYKKRLQNRATPLTIPPLSDAMRSPQKWLIEALQFAVMTNISKFRNIALVGMCGSGKSYICNVVEEANSKNELVCSLPNVTNPTCLELLHDYHKMVVIRGVAELNLTKICGEVENLLTHRTRHDLKRKNGRTETLNTSLMIVLAVFNTDNITSLLACPTFHKCGTVIMFSPPRERISEIETKLVQEANHVQWISHKRTRIYVPYALSPGSIHDLFPTDM